MLRARAGAFWVLTAILTASPASQVYLRAGSETWIGPTPTRCLDDLLRARTLLASAREDLAARARQLSREADLAEAARRLGAPS